MSEVCNCTLRASSLDDLSDIVDLIIRIPDREFKFLSLCWDREDLELFLRQVVEGKTLIMCIGTDIVGFLSYRKEPSRLFIEQLYLDANRRKEVGATMLRLVMDVLNKIGMPIACYVHSENIRMQRLLKLLRYTYIGQIEFNDILYFEYIYTKTKGETHEPIT